MTARGDARERWDIISTIVRVDVGASSRTRAGRGRGAARVDVMGWLRVLGLGTAPRGRRTDDDDDECDDDECDD